MSTLDVSLAHIKRLIHDEKHFTSRTLKYFQKKTGIDKELIAAGIALVLSVYLIQGRHAKFVANFILTLVPLLLSYVFIDEKPRDSVMNVYWAALSINTLSDGTFEDFFIGYYLIKLLMMSLYWLEPFCYAQKIMDALTILGLIQKDLITAAPRSYRHPGIKEHDLD